MKQLYFLLICLAFSCSKQKTKKQKILDNSFYKQAVLFRDSNKSDSAYLYFSLAKDVFATSKDSLGAGKCLLNMAIISTDKGDPFGGQELSLNAIGFFNSKDSAQYPYINSNYNNLGISNYQLKNYDKAIEFYNKSLIYTSDNTTKLTLKNNIANAYRRSGNFSGALRLYSHILSASLHPSDYARTVSNFAYTRWLQDKSYDANPLLEKSLRIRSASNNMQEQVSSLVYLIDVNENKQSSKALFYANRMYRIANVTHNPSDRLVALEKLIKLSPPATAKLYFELYHSLGDSIQTVRNRAKNQFALIRYESEKNKSENLILQKENAERKYQVARRDLFTLIGLLLIISASVILYLWYRKYKLKVEADKQKAVSENQLMNSKRVHDVVANGLYRVMNEIENSENVDKDEIIDKLELMYEKSRDISYDFLSGIKQEESFFIKINELLASFASADRRIDVAGNNPEFWDKITPVIKSELEHVLGELMINMKKHSSATTVSLLFFDQDGLSCIEYFDNGIGLPNEVKHNNGLTNTVSRIKYINGSITFGQRESAGCSVLITFPNF